LKNFGIGENMKVDEKTDSLNWIHKILWKNEYDFQDGLILIWIIYVHQPKKKLYASLHCVPSLFHSFQITICLV
jgi:hypothetical protein